MMQENRMLKRKILKEKLYNAIPLLCRKRFPVMPQAETSSQSDQVPSVRTELVEVPSAVVQINSDPDTSKVAVSNPHLVGTPVKVTRSGRVSKPPERLNL